jgi:hypothetical protein
LIAASPLRRITAPPNGSHGDELGVGERADGPVDARAVRTVADADGAMATRAGVTGAAETAVADAAVACVAVGVAAWWVTAGVGSDGLQTAAKLTTTGAWPAPPA